MKAFKTLSTRNLKARVELNKLEARTSGGLHDKFVKSEAFAAGLGDSGTGSFGEAHSGDVQLGAVEDSFVISDGSDTNGDSTSVSSEMLLHLGDGQWWAVGSGSEESPEDGCGELGAGSASEETE